MALTYWYDFFIEPLFPKAVCVYPAMTVVVAGGLQWWPIRRLRLGKRA
jgi:hypothetical protein